MTGARPSSSWHGGTARGQANDASDLDLLVDWEPDRSLLDVVGLKQDLEDLLGVTVDIGSERGLHWFRRSLAGSRAPVKSDLLYLRHIRECCGRVRDCVQAGREVFFGNAIYQDAAMRNLEIIGEAAKRISPELRDALKLPWRQIAGLRDVLIHDYPNPDLERIWLAASRAVPELLRAIEDFLRERGRA